MKPRTLLTTAALFAAALFILNVPTAYGTVTWDGEANDGLWSSPTNWSADTLPTIGDDVEFPVMTGTYTVTMDGAASGDDDLIGYARTLDVHVNATITILAGHRLEVSNAADLVSNIDGDIVLAGSGSTLRFMYDHYVQAKTDDTGTGQIIGEHNSAIIDDDPENARTLTIRERPSGDGDEMIIRGALTIQVSLVNDSRVLANDGTAEGTRDRLTLDSGTFTGSGTYEVNTPNAFLEFDAAGVTATGLATDFAVSNGTLDIDVNVTTTGELTFTGGTITVEAGDTFRAS